MKHEGFKPKKQKESKNPFILTWDSTVRRGDDINIFTKEIEREEQKE